MRSKKFKRAEAINRGKKGCKVHMLAELIDVVIADYLKEIERLREVKKDTSLDVTVNARIFEKQTCIKRLKMLRGCAALLEDDT